MENMVGTVEHMENREVGLENKNVIVPIKLNGDYLKAKLHQI
jgi:hypothetical protein